MNYATCSGCGSSLLPGRERCGRCLMPPELRPSSLPVTETPPNARSLIVENRALRAVLAVRERELLELKGPCRNTACRLHRGHSGPCDCVCTTDPKEGS